MENQSGNAPKTTPERRAEEVFAVLQKRKTAVQAAEDLGVSRKTFNEWLHQLTGWEPFIENFLQKPQADWRSWALARNLNKGL